MHNNIRSKLTSLSNELDSLEFGDGRIREIVELLNVYARKFFKDEEYIKQIGELCLFPLREGNVTISFNKEIEQFPLEKEKLKTILKCMIAESEIMETTNSEKMITNNINFTPNISQTQFQSQEVMIFISTLKDVLSNEQLNELKKIVVEERDNTDNAKKRLSEKLKTFGNGVLSSIIANLLTNPVLWNQILAL